MTLHIQAVATCSAMEGQVVLSALADIAECQVRVVLVDLGDGWEAGAMVVM